MKVYRNPHKLHIDKPHKLHIDKPPIRIYNVKETTIQTIKARGTLRAISSKDILMDYYKGLRSHFKTQEKKELGDMQTAHGEASMHPIRRMAYNHMPPPRKKPQTLKQASKMGKLHIIRKSHEG